MIRSTPFAERVQSAFKPTPRGVVGLVDDLLNLCRVHQLRMNFRDGHCSVRRLGADAQDALDVSVPKSVFRAVLARIAALCNEHHPHSVTPYRGEGEIVVPPPISPNCLPPSTCYVSFTNTPSEQQLDMRFSRSSAGEGSRFTVLLRDKRTVTVFGHAVQYVPGMQSNSNDSGSYGILSRVGGTEVLVALFRVSEVIGVFSGDLRELAHERLRPNRSMASEVNRRSLSVEDFFLPTDCYNRNLLTRAFVSAPLFSFLGCSRRCTKQLNMVRAGRPFAWASSSLVPTAQAGRRVNHRLPGGAIHVRKPGSACS